MLTLLIYTYSIFSVSLYNTPNIVTENVSIIAIIGIRKCVNIFCLNRKKIKPYFYIIKIRIF